MGTSNRQTRINPDDAMIFNDGKKQWRIPAGVSYYLPTPLQKKNDLIKSLETDTRRHGHPTGPPQSCPFPRPSEFLPRTLHGRPAPQTQSNVLFARLTPMSRHATRVRRTISRKFSNLAAVRDQTGEGRGWLVGAIRDGQDRCGDGGGYVCGTSFLNHKFPTQYRIRSRETCPVTRFLILQGSMLTCRILLAVS